MDLYEHYKEQYFHESDRRQYLSGAVTLPTGLLTVFGGAQLALVKQISRPFEIAEWVLAALAMANVVCIMIAIFYLIRSYFGHSYHHIATTQEIRDYKSKLENYYRRKRDPSSNARTEVTKHLESQYADFAGKNARTNDNRSHYLFLANGFIIVILVITGLSVCPYLYQSIGTDPKVLSDFAIDEDGFSKNDRR